MKNTKVIAVVLAAVMSTSLMAGCKKTTTTGSTKAGETTVAGEKKTSTAKIGLSTDEGGRGDKSFNDAAINGLEKFGKEDGVKPTIVESKQASQYVQNLETLAKNNDLTVAVGFKMGDAMTTVAKAQKDKQFLIVDSVIEEPNVKSVLFKEQEGSYLMGVIAGKLTKTNKIGFIGGAESDVIGRFQAGFIAGVMSVNPEAGKLLLDKTNVKYAGNFSDTNKGKELAKALYNSGVDVIFHAAGGVGLGVFDAAKEMKKFAIGVDSDQAAMLPDFKDVILVSMMKQVDVAVYEATKEYSEGKFKTGTTVLGLKENAVGLSPTQHDSLKNNAELQKLVEETSKKIQDGSIKVPATIKELEEMFK